GEILGITGLIGSGTTELAKVLFRSEDVRLESGEYKISGEAADIRDTKGALDRKIAFVPSDRKNEGLFAKFSIRDNVCLPSINSFRGRLNLIDNNKMNEVSREYIDLLSIKTPSCHASVQNLSGGNQQKVLLAKWLMTKPEILILDEPTIGIDIGTKHEIRKLILGMAESGISVILITSELEELEKLCSRVLVMFRGRIVSELTGKLINKKEILKAAMGGNKNDAIG
ncbi:MAG: sugar ABC transporter ATP-binding protein, partial [Spirochaetales bacterium]